MVRTLAPSAKEKPAPSAGLNLVFDFDLTFV
jgi:hypothetical protein